MELNHWARVQGLLRQAAEEHTELVARLPAELSTSLPVDAQGLTRAIDYLAQAAGLSEAGRRALVQPHGVNPAVLHARIFGAAPLARATVIGSFVEGARVRADALSALADTIGGEDLGQRVRSILLAHPLPADFESEAAADALRVTYAAQEEAALALAAGLDGA